MENIITKLRKLNVGLSLDNNGKLKLNAPTGVLTKEVLEEIRQHKGYLIDFVTGSMAKQSFSYIEKAPVKQHYAVSSAQKRQYFLYQLDRDSMAYNMPQVIKMDGDADMVRLKGIFRTLIDRHESFRTSFDLVDGSPVQKIAEKIVFSLPQSSLDGRTEEEIMEGFVKPFDLSVAPLLRAEVVLTTPGEFLLLIDTHHIISDGISLEVLSKEFRELYEGRELSPLRIQYKDYAEWQNAGGQTGKTADHVAYWLKNLQGSLPVLRLPLDFQRLPVDGDKGGLVTTFLTADEAVLLKKTAAEHNMTTSMFLYAVLGMLFSRLSGNEDMIIGLSVAGRNHPDLERIVGMFVNALPIRCQPARNKTVGAFLKEIKTATLAAYDHQDCQFDQLVERLGVQRENGRNPIFDVMLNMVGKIDGNVDLSEGISDRYTHLRGAKRFDLTLNVIEYQNTFFLQFQYDASLFAAASAERMLRYFRNILSAVANDDGQQLIGLSIEPVEKRTEIWDKLERFSWSHAFVREDLPASYHQERMWFIDRFESGYLYEKGPVYHNIPLIIDWEGLLDTALLEKSISRVVARHQVLSTRLITVNEQPLQKIVAPELGLRVIDCRQGGAEELVRNEVNTAFQLDEQLFRISLVRVGADRYKLVLVFHHSIADRYSVRKLTEEILFAYRGGEVDGEVTLQYGAFSKWQREALSQLDHWFLSYWKLQLGGRVAALEFPEDRQRVAIHTYTSASTGVLIPPMVMKKMQAFGERFGYDQHMLLMAAFKILLSRYSRQEEIVIGTSIDYRNTPLLKTLIGPASNLLVLRSFITPETSFLEYLQTLCKDFDQALSYGHMPFDKLVKELAPEKDMSRTALFDVFFQYEQSGTPWIAPDGVRLDIRDGNLGYGKYDLNLFLQAREEGIEGRLVFNSDYFDEWRMEGLMQHYYELIDQLLAHPNDPLVTAGMIGRQEENRLLEQFNYTDVHYPATVTVTDLFERQVALRGDKIAVRMGGETISYAELDRKAGKIAVLLQRKGVRPNTIVGLLMDRSPDTVIGMLGILKAGGAYLPIDTDYPEERINYLISDSGAMMVLTTAEHKDKAVGNVTVVLMEEVDGVSAEGFAGQVNEPADLCYVIYTSGTTGNPKGVMVEHRNVVRLLFNGEFAFDFGPDDVWTLFHSHCFDFSVWEMYGALLFGGTLIVIPKMTARDTRRYIDILRAERVTVLNQTPGAFYALIREELSDPGTPLALRYVIFGGEALSPGKLKQWRVCYPDVKLINMFGITETTVHVTYKEIGDHEIENNISNIGKPIPTLSVYLLDQQQRLVPNGIAGELYVGGAGVARGYLNKAELTAEKFVVNPYNPQERLYRSGDLARVLASGELEYIGRIDHQVKVRGFRIELGEIENQLLTQGSIRDVIVLAKASDGDTRLVAYYISEKEIPGLRKFLTDRLPEHMVPAYFVHLKTMPLTANGKADRKGLPDPEITAQGDYTAPVSDTEVQLAKIWGEVLQLDEKKIGTARSFFELGGHSLRATVLVSRINKTLQVDIKLKDIFTYQNIQRLGEYIDQQETTRFAAIRRAEKKNGYRLSSAQQRMYFLYELDRSTLAYNMPQVVRLEGELDKAKITAAFKKLVARHEILRTSFRDSEGEILQFISEDADLEVAWSETEESGIPDLIRGFIQPFNLSKAPLIRVGLTKSVHRDHILMVDMHHIVGDGVSQAVLIRDFLRFYNEETPAPLSLQYKDYAEWQQGSEHQADIARMKKFWLDSFAEEVPVLELPSDLDRSPEKRYEGATLGFSIGMMETDKLKEIAAAQNSTLFMVLLSIYNILLAKLTNLEDIVVGTPVAGRQHADLEQMIGMFVSTLPLRNHPRGDLSYGEFLKAVRDNTLAGFDNQAYPYETLVEELGLARDAGRNPLFDVLFTMQNFEETELRLPGITLKPYQREHSISKFDLSLTANELDGYLQLFFEYATGLFHEETIRRFVSYFKRIVSAVAADPLVRLSDIDILCAEEEFRLLQEFNNTAKAYPRNRTIVDLFEDQVHRLPQKQAVVEGGESLTYKQLNDRANQLALLLKVKGIRHQETVAIWADRSIDAVIAMIGILKAGGVYLPLDINYPTERLQFMLSDCAVRFLVSQRNKRPGFDIQATIIPIESALAMPVGSCLRTSVPEDRCYIMYTSGSTGTPKGVMVSHRNVVRLVKKADWITLNEETRLMQTGTLSFDASTFEIWGSLLNGGALFFIDNDVLLNTRLLSEALEANQINTLWLTASLFDQHAREKPAMFGSLRWLISGGDVLTPSTIALVMGANPLLRVLNGYGPTENVVFSTVHSISQPPVNPIPIGKPINNSTAYVFDKYQRLQPVGVVGELYVGGEGVAPGYHNNTALTDERFIPNPYRKNERLYRTGDLARWVSGGVLEFKGRIDQQVKIRGFRIEPGEIEHRLSAYEGVSGAAVLVKKAEGYKYLVAYYISSREIPVEEWRSFLASQLPDYMMPSYFVRMDVFPLTPNGKLDRKAFPAEKRTEEEYIDASTAEEKILAGIWQKVLGRERVGVTQNFFSAGGDSIKSIQIISRLRSAGYEISVRDLFVAQTIRQLVSRLKPLESQAEQSAVTGVSALTPIQQWFVDGPIKRKHHYNQSVLLNFKEGIKAETVRQLFSRIQQHHDALRMVCRMEGGVVAGLENRGAELAVSLYEQDLREQSQPAQALTAACEQLQAGISLADGPLMKLGLFHMQDGSRLLIVIHHLVIDGISWRILFEDIETLYRQQKEGGSFELPLKTDPFLSWAGHLAKYKETDTFKNTAAYWKEALAKDWSPLPKEYPGFSGLTASTANRAFTISEEDSSRLLTKVNAAFGTRINDILLTALLLSMKKQFGRHSVRIDLEGHGREAIQAGVNMSRTVGWFTSIYPVILESGENDLRAAIRTVKESLRKVPNKGIDFLLHGYGDSRSEICFNYLGQFDSDMQQNSYQIATEDKGQAVSPTETREYLWEITGMVAGGQLGMSLAYDRRFFGSATMDSFMDNYRESLLEVIDYCCSLDKEELTPSDLTVRDLSFDLLDQLQVKYPVQDIYPLSPMQEGMLFHSLLDPESDFYFEQMTYRLQGKLDINAVEASVRQLISRYDILRTLFIHEGLDRPLQVVLKERDADLIYKDVRGEGADQIGFYQQEDKSRKFNPGLDPLMRLTVLRTGTEDWCFIWSFHHIIMDGWCLSILINEFGALCAANSGATGITLPPAGQYSQYIEWLEKRDKAASGSYWGDYLSAYTGLASFPKKPAQAETVYLPGTYGLTIDEGRTKQLQELCSKYSVTINTLFQTIWGILLGKYNGVGDVVFGAVVSGRPSEIEGIETMVGLFINTIPVRIRYKAESSFVDVVKKTQDDAIASQPFHHHSLTETQSISGWGNQLLDHILVFENYPIAEEIGTGGAGSETNDYRIVDFTAAELTNYDLSVVIMPGKDIKINFDYNAAVYDSRTIERMTGHLLDLVGRVVSDEKLRLSEIGLLSRSEAAWLDEWNETGMALPAEDTVLSLIGRQPMELTAVECDGVRQSYGQLEELSDRIGVWLRESAGIQRGDRVGVLMGRELLLPGVLMGVWKAGAAYVPIDPSYPAERINDILTDGEVKYVLNEETVKKIMRRPLELTAGVKGVVPAQDDLAYVLFTSGSTGRPKGVMISHRSLLNYVSWASESYFEGEPAVLPLFTSVSFDLTLTSIFTPLISGGKVVVYHEEELDLLLKWILGNRELTGIKLTPSHLRLVRELGVSGYVRKFIVGGEDLETELARSILKLFGEDTEIFNEYGPTEATVGCMIYRFTGLEAGASVPIGRPAWNTEIHLFDKDGHGVPVGVEGEIYIGGEGLAKGYLNRDELTAERFVCDERWEGVRLYRTGDLGVMNAEGELLFRGRRDDQVKLRGYRIELGEIGSRLSTHELVGEAVAVIREIGGEKTLVAYYTGSGEEELLRSWLGTQLPVYMVPSYLRRMDHLPVTVNGKLDLKKLPVIERGEGEDYTAPVGEVEKKLVAMWSELLKMEEEKIGVNKSFFELGGHSLKAMTLTSLISKEFNVRVPLAELFKAPTIKQLGVLIGADRRGHKHVAIPVAPVMDFYPLSFPQRRLYLLHQLDQQSLAYNMPYKVRLNGDLNIRRLENIFRQLIGRHESLRTSFTIEDREPVQKIAAAVDFGVTVFDAAEDGTEDIIQSFVRPFALGKAPLMRVGLIREEEDTAVLVVDMHHIISDGVSQQLLMKEFQSLYRLEALAPLTLQYKDYAQWQHSDGQRLEIQRQQAFWRQKFSSTPATINLPADYPRPAVKNFEGGMVELRLSRSQTQVLRNLAESEGCTVFMVLLSVYSILVSKLGASEDIVIGTSTAGRQHADLENIVGMFVNTLPLRVRPASHLSFREFLATVSSDTIACFDHQAFPYEELIDELQLERDFSRNPLFDIMFSYQTLEAPEKGSTGLSVSSCESDHRVAKFDLTLAVTEGEGNIQLGFEYASALFDEETIGRFAGYFSRILSAIAVNKELRLSDIGLLSRSEAARLDEWNETEMRLPAEETVLSLIGRQALELTAVECDGVRQSYGQLQELSDRIGVWLQESAGIQRGDRVGVLMGRELFLPGVLMGVWKAGAAYVPIDPSYPAERINDILTDGEVKYVLNAETVKKIMRQPLELTAGVKGVVPAQDDLAYVLFTSGSTGRPKGVMISHRSLLNYVSWASASYFKGTPAVLPLFTSVGFDLTLTSIFTPLISGGKVVVYGEEEVSGLLKRVLENKELTGIKLTPSHLRLVRELGIGGLVGVRKWIVGGEDLETELARSILKLFGEDTEIFNEYGPTEATVGCMIYRFTGLEAGASVPIGRPAWNTEIYLLDKDGHRVPAGVEGEIYIGGEGLAKGYLNRDELTAERFISNDRGRLYRTGDLGVMNAEGELLFRGRRDDQVKLRGYRIELGEIGSRLSAHALVGEAVAVIREIGGEKILVAYYTGSGEEEALRSWLATQLPVYMVPSYLRRMDHLPVTVNGKLDLKNLPVIERGEGEDYTAPTSEIEEQLVAIWSELLKMEKEKISINKSFFELGGNSLKIIQLNALVNKTLNWNLSVAVLFRYTTIASLIEYVSKGEDNPDVYKQEVSDELADMENMFDILSNTNLIEHEQF